jgi:hypothetical protein
VPTTVSSRQNHKGVLRSNAYVCFGMDRFSFFLAEPHNTFYSVHEA